jgi:hypothetical protein
MNLLQQLFLNLYIKVAYYAIDFKFFKEKKKAGYVKHFEMSHPDKSTAYCALGAALLKPNEHDPANANKCRSNTLSNANRSIAGVSIYMVTVISP